MGLWGAPSSSKASCACAGVGEAGGGSGRPRLPWGSGISGKVGQGPSPGSWGAGSASNLPDHEAWRSVGTVRAPGLGETLILASGAGSPPRSAKNKEDPERCLYPTPRGRHWAGAAKDGDSAHPLPPGLQGPASTAPPSLGSALPPGDRFTGRDSLIRGDGLTCGTAPRSPREAAVCRWMTPRGSETAPPACAWPGPEGDRGTAVGSQWEERPPPGPASDHRRTFPGEGRAGSAPHTSPPSRGGCSPHLCVWEPATSGGGLVLEERDSLPETRDRGLHLLPCPWGYQDLREVS